MKLVSFAASGRNSYGPVVGDGVFDLGRRLGDRYPTLRAAIAGDALGAAAAEVKTRRRRRKAEPWLPRQDVHA